MPLNTPRKIKENIVETAEPSMPYFGTSRILRIRLTKHEKRTFIKFIFDLPEIATNESDTKKSD